MLSPSYHSYFRAICTLRIEGCRRKVAKRVSPGTSGPRIHLRFLPILSPALAVCDGTEIGSESVALFRVESGRNREMTPVVFPQETTSTAISKASADAASLPIAQDVSLSPSFYFKLRKRWCSTTEILRKVLNHRGIRAPLAAQPAHREPR